MRHHGCTLVVVVLCWLVAAPAGYAQPSGYEGYQVVRVKIADQAQLNRLRELESLGRDFQVWSEVTRIGVVEVRVAPAAQAALQASGLQYEVAVEDLQQYLDTLYAEPRDDDFFNSLRTYEEHVQFMDDLAAAYPDLAEVIYVGFSVQGRALLALRITGPSEVKPGVLYHGAEHGDEQAPASVVAYVANHLLTNYGTDPAATALVDNVEWYLMPIMNPDGYVAYDRWNAHGVDLNRNWDGPGSGQDPWGGPFPFSEPETIVMRDFLLEHPTVRVHLDLHGYVPWVMWPWAHTSVPCPDDATFEVAGTEFRDLIYDSGGGWYEAGSIYDVAYPISGCSSNYTYGELGLWAFAVEVLDADMPDICEEFLSSMLYLGEWIRSIDCNGNGVDDAEDIASGTSLDCNATGVPDECEAIVSADFDADGVISLSDFTFFSDCMAGPSTPPSPSAPECADTCLSVFDFGGDTDVDLKDFARFLFVFQGS
jgi:hypothetical protein